jgi:hypothetical protein
VEETVVTNALVPSSIQRSAPWCIARGDGPTDEKVAANIVGEDGAAGRGRPSH